MRLEATAEAVSFHNMAIPSIVEMHGKDEDPKAAENPNKTLGLPGGITTTARAAASGHVTTAMDRPRATTMTSPTVLPTMTVAATVVDITTQVAVNSPIIMGTNSTTRIPDLLIDVVGIWSCV